MPYSFAPGEENNGIDWKEIILIELASMKLDILDIYVDETFLSTPPCPRLLHQQVQGWAAPRPTLTKINFGDNLARNDTDDNDDENTF